jgi:mannose-1-phosphate guanylyltransferase
LKALLLAAGFGTRLRPLTEHTPKCLVPIHGRPLLDYWLDRLLDDGIDHAVINTHYLADKVQAHVRASRWASRTTLAHEPVLLGTGGTVLANRSALEGGPFLVAHADNLCTFDVRAFIAAHAGRPAGVEITMMTFVTDTPESCGIVQTDEQGRVVAFHEKVRNPPGRVANGAVYILEPSVLDFLSTLGRPVIDLSTEVIPRYLGRIVVHANDGYLRDIGSPEALAAAHREFPG